MLKLFLYQEVTGDSYRTLTRHPELTDVFGLEQIPGESVLSRTWRNHFDRSRDVRASLRFTDDGVEERFNWESDQMADIESKLRSMMDLVEQPYSFSVIRLPQGGFGGFSSGGDAR